MGTAQRIVEPADPTNPRSCDLIIPLPPSSRACREEALNTRNAKGHTPLHTAALVRILPNDIIPHSFLPTSRSSLPRTRAARQRGGHQTVAGARGGPDGRGRRGVRAVPSLASTVYRVSSHVAATATFPWTSPSTMWRVGRSWTSGKLFTLPATRTSIPVLILIRIPPLPRRPHPRRFVDPSAPPPWTTRFNPFAAAPALSLLECPSVATRQQPNAASGMVRSAAVFACVFARVFVYV